MPKASSYVLKDSPAEFIEAAGVQPKGRSYNSELAKNPGAVHIEELLLGTKLACIAITDDKKGTLKKVGKANPWHIEALKMITGSEEEAHKSLTHILAKHLNLQCDEILDLSGFSGGHPIDTQGYIAHNDEIVVVSFRCTTSALDWMTNLATATSAWEIDEDEEQGHSGYCSCIFDTCFKRDPDKPRVHTGFYNNVIKTVPHLKKHVAPLLDPDQPPRTLYVVGHSLGAGLSTLATIYFLEHFPWKELPHRLINISAGTPRSVKKAMGERVDNQLKELRSLGKAKICRIVMNEDLVAKIPPLHLGFVHVGKLILLTEDGHVLVGPKTDDEHIIDEKEMQNLCETNPELVALEEEQEKTDEGEADSLLEKTKSKYEKMMEKLPRPVRDHCPDYYLAPLVKLHENINGPPVSTNVTNLPIEIFDGEVVKSLGTGDDSQGGGCCTFESMGY